MMIDVKGVYETNDRWPLRITKIENNQSREFPKITGTYYVLLNNAVFTSNSVNFRSVNAAFAVNSGFEIRCSGAGTAVVIEYLGLRLLESRYFVQDELGPGNLSYMDGGTNTTAVNPGRLGDPVVNYVHFPAGMYQTLHTHPSHRVGLVLQGRGSIELDHEQFFELQTGSAFFMQRNTLHNFICNHGKDVKLFVFAPDSGTGPTDDVNPLKIRTYIGQQRFN